MEREYHQKRKSKIGNKTKYKLTQQQTYQTIGYNVLESILYVVKTELF